MRLMAIVGGGASGSSGRGRRAVRRRWLVRASEREMMKKNKLVKKNEKK